MHPDGEGYDALRPTRGWLRVSAKRLRAQARLAEMNMNIVMRKLNAARA